MPSTQGNREPIPARTGAEQLWLQLLAELEQSLAPDAALRDSAEPHAGSRVWQAPSRLPAMPETLRERASALHELQLRRQAELQAERAQVQRQIEVLRSVPRPRAASASVYLDVAG